MTRRAAGLVVAFLLLAAALIGAYLYGREQGKLDAELEPIRAARDSAQARLDTARAALDSANVRLGETLARDSARADSVARLLSSAAVDRARADSARADRIERASTFRAKLVIAAPELVDEFDDVEAAYEIELASMAGERMSYLATIDTQQRQIADLRTRLDEAIATRDDVIAGLESDLALANDEISILDAKLHPSLLPRLGKALACILLSSGGAAAGAAIPPETSGKVIGAAIGGGVGAATCAVIG